MPSRSLLGIVSLSLIVSLGAACATKTFVRQSVQQVEQQVANEAQRTHQQIEALNAGLSQQQDRLAGTQEKVAAVQSQATGAQQSAAHAQQSADAASADTRQLASSLSTLSRVVVLDDTAQTFARNSDRLSPEASAALDAFVATIRAEDRGVVWIEIEGHTDASGDAAYNVQLSARRAEAVRTYLASKSLPLHKMSVIGYGAAQPVAPNTTRAGRAQNRRVVIRVVR